MYRCFRALKVTALASLALVAALALPGAANAQSLYQVVNAISDPGIAAVDVQFNTVVVADDLASQGATDFQGTAPGPVTIDVYDAAGTTLLFSDSANFTNGVNYTIVLRGVQTPGLYAPNPDGADISLAMTIFEGMKTSADNPATAEMLPVHAAPDIGTIDLVARTPGAFPGQGTVLVSALQYGDVLPYIVLAPAGAILDVRLSADPRQVIGSFEAQFGLVVGGAVVGFASRFENPSANNGGALVGLTGALGTGGGAIIFELDRVASYQLINNSPDPAVGTVDIYVDDVLAIDDLAPGVATDIEWAFAGTRKFDIAPSTSASSAESFYTENVLVEFGEQYISSVLGMAAGNEVTNPDARSTSIDLLWESGYRAYAQNPAQADLAGIHAVPDLGTIDIKVRTGSTPGVGITLISGLAYGDYTPYLNLSPGGAVLDVVETGTTNALYSYEAEFGLVVGAGVQGMLTGLAAGAERPLLKGALSSGFIFVLDRVSATGAGDLPLGFAVDQNYPNPFNPLTTIPVQLDSKQPLIVAVYDLQGRLVKTVFDGILEKGAHALPFSGEGLSSGTYLYRVTTVDQTLTKSMVLTK